MLERAAEDLRNFHNQARTNYGSYVAARRGPLKRTKETSAYVGVSPDTQKSRPPPKRQTSRRQLHYAQGALTKYENSKVLSVQYHKFDKGSSQEMSGQQGSACSSSAVQTSSRSALPLLTVTEPLPLQECINSE